MRCFIAIDIDDDVRKELAALQEKLRAQADLQRGDVKWVSPEQVHLTLKFLGEVKDAHVPEVCGIVQEVASAHPRFMLDIGTVGYFGARARVLWVGLGRGSERLNALQEELEECLEQSGWPREEKGFSGHLTLCRIKNTRAGMKLTELARGYKDYSLGTLEAASVVVYQSQLAPSGPIYTVLGNYKLS